MSKSLLHFLDLVFRGYAQLFLAHQTRPGLLFFAGLLVLSPLDGLRSLIGGVTITSTALLLAPTESTIKSGLFGVNGVLLGSLWFLFPELSETVKILGTVIGSLLMAGVLVPCTGWMRRHQISFTLFSLPYVIMAWLCITCLSWTYQTDVSLQRGWYLLASHKYAEAHHAFATAQTRTLRAEGYRLDGLGWSCFHLHCYEQAYSHFQACAKRAPRLADAYDGLGWSAFKLGRLEQAQAHFQQAVGLNPLLADSWDGRGWTALLTHQVSEAKTSFYKALCAAPFFSDAYTGLARCHTLLGEKRQAARCQALARFFEHHVAPRYHRLPSAQLLCWGLFFLGVLCYSRLSALVALLCLVLCGMACRLLPAFRETFLDLSFLFNMLALSLALGGHYLQLRPLLFLWLGVIGAGMTVYWQALMSVLMASGLPVLCLPFNLVLILSTLLFVRCRTVRSLDIAVPLDVAIHTPEDVRLWTLKKKIAQACWSRLSKSDSRR